MADDRLSRALDEFANATNQVSTNNRYISFGLVAIAYALLTSEAPFATSLIQKHGYWVLLISGTGCLGVICDYLHYVFAVRSASRAIDNRTPGHEHEFNKH